MAASGWMGACQFKFIVVVVVGGVGGGGVVDNEFFLSEVDVMSEMQSGFSQTVSNRTTMTAQRECFY